MLPAFQRRGIGLELYGSLFAFLKQIGVHRVDARIASENLPSIGLHRGSGWKVGRDAEGLLATISLQPPARPC
ncbi:MAG: GNAT family N-acetyltransferase [Candidatus Acidiferrales bacterium]